MSLIELYIPYRFIILGCFGEGCFWKTSERNKRMFSVTTIVVLLSNVLLLLALFWIKTPIISVETIIVLLVIALFWIIWTFYNNLSFLVRRLSRILSRRLSQGKQRIVFILVTALFWIIWKFYNTLSFLVHRLSRILSRRSSRRSSRILSRRLSRRLSQGKQINVISSSSSYPTVQAILDVVIDQIEIKQFFGRIFEEVVLLLYLLMWVASILRVSLEYFKHPGIPVGPSTTNFTNATTRNLTADNVEQVFRNNTHYFETTSLHSIYVYSCPLTAPFSSSTESFRSVIQRQYLPVDYHAYVVFHTGQNGSEMWWALDKHTKGIFLSWGINKDWVVHFFKGKPRAEPIKKLAEDLTKYPVSDLARRLKKILKSNEYDLIEKNCQHFSKEIFDKFATDEKWEYTTPIDMTSPLKLTTNFLIYFIIPLLIVTELILLFTKSRENESSHYQYVVYFVLIFILILYIFHGEHWCDIHVYDLDFRLHLPVLSLEAVFYAPLYTIRKRGAQFRKMCRSGNIFYKCWLSVCFGMMYTLTSYKILVLNPLRRVILYTLPLPYGHYLGYPGYLTSLEFAIPTLHGIASWLFYYLNVDNFISLAVSSVVLTGFYLNL